MSSGLFPVASKFTYSVFWILCSRESENREQEKKWKMDKKSHPRRLVPI